MNDAILKLKKLGLSFYEAKAFLALLQKHPANGYEISKLGKIPPSKVYETLQGMKHRGLVIPDEQTDPVQYYPIPYEKLVHRFKQDFRATIDELEAELQQIQPLPQIDLAWNLQNYQQVVAKLTELIDQATATLLLSVWPAELDLLRAAVARAEARGVRVIAGVFGSPDLATPYRIDLSLCGVSSQRRLNACLTVVVADEAEVVISEIRAEATVGIWTHAPGIVLVAKEYIKHDIWGRILIETLGEERFDTLCVENELLALLMHRR